MASRKNKTPISKIVDYWASRIDECDLSVDWSEAEEYCWNCGSPKELTRCHIVPDSLGGADEPSNFVVLCRQCHEEAPNVADPRIMWDWLIAHKTAFYRTYWIEEGWREYEFIYKRSVAEELEYIREHADGDQGSFDMERYVEESVRNSTTHFGQYVPNKATAAGMLRMALMKMAEECGVVLPDDRAPVLTPAKYLT